MVSSVIAAAQENGNAKVIGVDVDQSSESNTVITSATKGLREGTMFALAKFFDGKWDELSDKAINLGAADSAVGLPTDTWSMKNFTIDQYKAMVKDVFNKNIRIVFVC